MLSHTSLCPGGCGLVMGSRGCTWVARHGYCRTPLHRFAFRRRFQVAWVLGCPGAFALAWLGSLAFGGWGVLLAPLAVSFAIAWGRLGPARIARPSFRGAQRR